MAFGNGIPGGHGGEPVVGNPHPTEFRRRNDYRPSANAECEIYPHAVPKIPVSDYVKEIANRLWLLPQYNWQNACNPISEPQILYADPWRRRLVQWPLGYTQGATGTTKYFTQCWRFNREGKGKRLLERLFAPSAPEGFNLCLVVSGVTWWFSEENRCSTSLIARVEGIINNESHEKFIMEKAGKLLADVKAWLKGA
jgi:hypothetical protein